jgi:signal transduction histidine kinase
MDIEEAEVPDSLRVVIFRVVQEALSNVARHSQADHVRLSLLKKNASLEFAIQDNGIGFQLDGMDAADHPDKGMGLSTMKERVELAGGSFAIQTGRGSGTLIRTSYSVRQESYA